MTVRRKKWRAALDLLEDLGGVLAEHPDPEEIQGAEEQDHQERAMPGGL